MKKAGLFIIVFMVLFFTYEGFDYLKYRSDYAVSDAGFVKSDTLSILGFKVPGKVKSIKTEGEYFKKGDILTSLDKVDYVLKKQKLQKELLSLSSKIDELKIKKNKTASDINSSIKIASRDINSFTQKIMALEVSIKALNSKLTLIKKNKRRFKNLIKQKLIPKSKYEDISTSKDILEDEIKAKTKTLKSLRVDLNSVKEKYKIAKNKELVIKELKKELESLKYKKEAMEVGLKELDKSIEYCTIVAPFDGVVAKRFVNKGRVVSAGYPVLSVLNPHKLHAEVLLSEKKLHGVKKGAEVIIKADAVEDKEFKGEVEEILPASASTFSLVPRDIASGEFTKLDQRFVVRIKLKDKNKNDLRVGMSLNIAIKRD